MCLHVSPNHDAHLALSVCDDNIHVKLRKDCKKFQNLWRKFSFLPERKLHIQFSVFSLSFQQLFVEEQDDKTRLVVPTPSQFSYQESFELFRPLLNHLVQTCCKPHNF